jgi:hypothetical protein
MPACSSQWFLYGPLYRQADAFVLEELATRSIAVSIVDGMAFELLAAAARDFGAHNAEYAGQSDALVPPAVVDAHFYAVIDHFADFERHGAYRVIRQQQVLRGAYLLAVEYNLPLFDSMQVAAAEADRVPLLVADADQYQAFLAIAARRPEFRVVWLPDYRSSLG